MVRAGQGDHGGAVGGPFEGRRLHHARARSDEVNRIPRGLLRPRNTARGGNSMSKVGVRLKIDVSKIDKARLFKGQKGVYLDATCFIDLDEKGQYGDNGMVTQDVSKEEREQGVKGPILGNVTVFYRDDQGGQQQAPQQPQSMGQQGAALYGGQQQAPADDFDDTIPF